MGLDKGLLLRYYKRKDIQEAMIEYARGKEIGIRYGDGFGKRPDVLNYPRDIISTVMNGATSFHCSEETWENPLQLGNNLNKQELEELREGWDLILDIDCKFIDYSKICADLIIRFLKHSGVKSINCKFSGNKGFHIGVPFEAFPPRIKGIETRLLFPEAPKKIALYIKGRIEQELGKRILEFEKGDFGQIKEKTGFDKEIIRYEKNEFGDEVGKLNVDPFLEIDTILIAPRHLCRMCYSLHEKSGLSSIVIDPDKVMAFGKKMAIPAIVKPSMKFMEREVEESAGRLLLQALDFKVKKEEKDYEREIKKDYEKIKIESAIQEECFPPCIKTILKGLDDGRKRAVFCMINFLGKLGWEKKEIKDFLLKWNKENKEGLRENYITGQLHYFKAGDKLPPNCSNDAYYKDIGVCKPDRLCKRIKNPVNYAIGRWRWLRQDREKEENKKRREENRRKKEKKEIKEIKKED